MADEPRSVQRLERIKINANKYMKVLEKDPDNENAQKRLQDMLRGIELLQFQAAADAVKDKHKKGGVHIKVPVMRFELKSDAPAVSE